MSCGEVSQIGLLPKSLKLVKLSFWWGFWLHNSVFNILIVVCIDVLRQNLRSTFSSDPSLHNYSELVPGLLENSTIFDMFITVALLYTWISITCFFNPFQNSGDSLGLKGLKELKSPPRTAANWQTPLCKVVFWSMLACFVFFDLGLLFIKHGSSLQVYWKRCLHVYLQALFACFWASFACFFVLQAIFCLLSPQSTVCMFFCFFFACLFGTILFFFFFSDFCFPDTIPFLFSASIFCMCLLILVCIGFCKRLFVCFSTSVCSCSEAVFAFLSKGLCWYLICFFCFLFACVLLEALFVCSCCFLKVGMHVFLSVVCFFSKALCLCVSFHCWMIFMFWAAVFACILFVWLIHWLLDVCLHFFCGRRLRFDVCLYAFSQRRSFHNFGACSWLGLKRNVSPSKSPKVESNLETADALAMAWCIRTVCNASQGNGKFPTLHLTPTNKIAIIFLDNLDRYRRNISKCTSLSVECTNILLPPSIWWFLFDISMSLHDDSCTEVRHHPDMPWLLWLAASLADRVCR